VNILLGNSEIFRDLMKLSLATVSTSSYLKTGLIYLQKTIEATVKMATRLVETSC
jgi:hypothetical protein